jgi:hypothetical protein
MKTNKTIYLVLAICLFFVVACKDDNSDSRDLWVGTYIGESEYLYSANGGNNTLDTVYYNDKLTVSKNGEDGLAIDYSSLISVSLPVNCDAEGKFIYENYPHVRCEGQFIADSVYFIYNESSQGRSATYNFKGKK